MGSEMELQPATWPSAISTTSWSPLTRQNHCIFRNCLIPAVRMPVIVGVRPWQLGEGPRVSTQGRGFQQATGEQKLSPLAESVLGL